MKQNRTIKLRHLALNNIRYQRFRSIIVFVLLVITTVALFLSDFLTESMSEGITKTADRIGADLIVVPDTFVSSIENALFLGKPCTVNFDRSWIDKIGAIEGVKKVSSQLYLSSLSQDCCDSSLQLIAFDNKTDFTVTPWLSKEGIASLKDNEIILGSNIKKKIGDQVKYFGRIFTVKDVLDESGMGYDSCAFINYEAAYDVAKDTTYKNILPFSSDNDVISMVLVDIDENETVSEVKDKIISQYGEDGIAVYTTNELLTKFTDNLRNLKVYGEILKILFLLLAVASLYAIFTITIHQRRHEFGSMLSVGIPREMIVRMLLWEMLLIIIAASIVGISLVCGVIIPFHIRIKSLLKIPYLLPDESKILSMIIKMFVINFIICGVTSFQSFWKFSRAQAAELIKEENG